tara:strand:+ start:364 stop:561 length:198 start_codon:yes stop_codon:yes gene_type:complete
MKAGMLVKVKPNHTSAGNMGLILECDDVEYDSVALVQWFDGSTYWINIAVLEEITKSDKKCPQKT